jgi:hypothetical protein
VGFFGGGGGGGLGGGVTYQILALSRDH